MCLEQEAKRLASVFRRMKRVQWKKSPIEGVTYSEFLVLVHLNREVKEEKGLTVSRLSELLQVTKPTVTQLINRLEQFSYIERQHDKQDRRVVRISLSSFGKEQMKKAYDEYVSFYNGLLDVLGKEKSQQLADLLDEVHDYYEQMTEKKER